MSTSSAFADQATQTHHNPARPAGPAAGQAPASNSGGKVSTQTGASHKAHNPTQDPMRDVLWWSTPDPRHAFYKDLHLACGHMLHRPMRKGSDGKYHVPKHVRCTCCGKGHVAKAKHLPGFNPTTPPKVQQPSQSNPQSPDAISVTEPEARFKITTAWSPRDLAARNYD
jgi:hypothetical protein